MTLVFAQRPQRHFRRGPPKLQMRAPESDAKDRGQDAAAPGVGAGGAGWEGAAQRTRYQERAGV